MSAVDAVLLFLDFLEHDIIIDVLEDGIGTDEMKKVERSLNDTRS
jgi:hypothetical protein